MLAKIAVADYMSAKMITVTPDTEITQAVKNYWTIKSPVCR